MDDQERGARYSDLFGAKHDHPSDCAYCPICATIAVVRKTRPEVLEHLSVAARELVLAAGILLEEASEILGAEPKIKSEDVPSEGAKIRRIDVG
jgi:hypothetical protein